MDLALRIQPVKGSTHGWSHDSLYKGILPQLQDVNMLQIGVYTHMYIYIYYNVY